MKVRYPAFITDMFVNDLLNVAFAMTNGLAGAKFMGVREGGAFLVMYLPRDAPLSDEDVRQLLRCTMRARMHMHVLNAFSLIVCMVNWSETVM